MSPFPNLFPTDIMFYLPDQPRGSGYVISEEVVEGQKPLFEQPQTKSA